MKTIAIDLDSTLNTLDEDWTAELSKRYNCNVTKADMKNWNANTWKPEGCHNVYEVLSEPGWFDSLGVQPHSQEVVQWLSERYDIYIATAYSPNTCMDKTNWLKRNFPMINPKNIIFINPKHLLNTDYLIDDGPHNIVDFKQKGILVDAPWNQHLGEEYLRLNNWLEIKEFFEKEGNLVESL
jgi:5'-nucleotidase